jgi:hypothetical protein
MLKVNITYPADAQVASWEWEECCERVPRVSVYFITCEQRVNDLILCSENKNKPHSYCKSERKLMH